MTHTQSTFDTEAKTVATTKKKLSDRELEDWAIKFYWAYPLHKFKLRAVKAAIAAMKSGKVTPERLLAAATAYAESDKVQKNLTAGTPWFIPYPSSWITAGGYDDEAPPKAKAGRPHFTLDEAAAVWMVLRHAFTTKTPDWDRFIDMATRDTPVSPNCQIEQNLYFDEFGLLVDPRTPRSITVIENRAVDHDKAQAAQDDIDALLAGWKQTQDCESGSAGA